MQIRTRRNGGESSIQDVAAAWKSEVHEFAWSGSESDTWAVELAKKLKEAQLKEGPDKLGPQSIH
jgi:hypothetical protein